MQYKNIEFNNIISPILENSEFNKLKDIKHHGITRLNHSIRIAYYSYLITKFLHLNYKEVTIAALLHDFFIDEVSECNGFMKLVKHPEYALNNALKYYELSDIQKDIILTHMFPIGINIPKYIESWIVDIIDDVASIYERIYSTRKQLKNAVSYTLIFIINIFRFIK